VADSLTYVFCLVRSARRPRLPKTAERSGHHLRLLPAGERLWLVVSSVAARDYDEAALAKRLQNLDWVGRQALVHESVVEGFLSAEAVLPMTLFTLFTADDRALAYVTKNRRGIGRILARIERQLEWGLRLTFDESSARERVNARAARVRGKAPASGSSYLARKRDLHDVTRVQLADARAEADRLFTTLSRAATDARRRASTESAAPNARLLLDAAFLVPAGRSTAFRSALRRQTRALGASGVAVSLTGPWPPYNFIDPPARASRSRRSAS
jgi:hypothetical protein